MKIVDVNILLYAINRSDPRHSTILRWWESALVGDEPIGLCWIVVLGFLRISTSSRALPKPLLPQEAMDRIEAWLSHPNVELVAESDEHWPILKEQLNQLALGGNITTDAHLAAIAIGNGATLASCDTDFSQFPKLRWEYPLRSSS